MTFVKDVFGRGMFKDFDKLYVGFDDQFNKMAKIHDDLTKSIPNYPPYNIKKTGDLKYLDSFQDAVYQFLGFVSWNQRVPRDAKTSSIKRSFPKDVLNRFARQQSLEIRK